MSAKPLYLTLAFEEDKVPWWLLLLNATLPDKWEKAYKAADRRLTLTTENDNGPAL